MHNEIFFPSTPISYAVEITYACINNCPGCINTWSKKRNLHAKNWKKLFDSIAPPRKRDKHTELIRITGGEPTLHYDFKKIIKYVDTFDIPYILFTSGNWHHPHEIVNILASCQNMIGILVSLHGANEIENQKFVGNTHSFRQVSKNILLASSSGISVFTNCVLTDHNVDNIEEIIAYSRNIGSECSVFNRFIGSKHYNKLDERKLKLAIKTIERNSEQTPTRIGNSVPQCFLDNSSEGNNGGIEHCYVSPDGFIRPQNYTDYFFGNVFEESIYEIWNSERAVQYRGSFPQNCLSCVEFQRCRGGEWFLNSKMQVIPDPLMKEPIKEKVAETYEFDPNYIPIPLFKIRQEEFGCMATRYNWSVPFTNEAKKILISIDGISTLENLYNKFGEVALSVIGILLEKNALTLEMADYNRHFKIHCYENAF